MYKHSITLSYRYAYFVVDKQKISPTDLVKANLKDPGLEKLFIDLGIKEAISRGKNGTSLRVKSWDIIESKIKELKCVILFKK